MGQKIYLIGGLLLSSVVGCTYDNYEDLHPKEASIVTTTTGSDSIKFSSDIKPILITNCSLNNSACHGTPASFSGHDYNSYAGVKEVVTTDRIIGAISHAAGYAPMPKGNPQLSMVNIDKIKKWVAQGALNN